MRPKSRAARAAVAARAGRAARAAALVGLVALAACRSRDVPAGPGASPPGPAAPSAPAGPPAPPAGPPAPVEWIEADLSEAPAAQIAREVARARADRRPVLVYVGAPWCEPCTRFHQAVADHELDAAFPGLRIVAFDLDRDGAALRADGYGSELVPLFAEPAADGTASGRSIQGSVKGQGVVANLAPRLRALLAPPAP